VGWERWSGPTLGWQSRQPASNRTTEDEASSPINFRWPPRYVQGCLVSTSISSSGSGVIRQAHRFDPSPYQPRFDQRPLVAVPVVLPGPHPEGLCAPCFRWSGWLLNPRCALCRP
jgi:hypothetical protein